MHKLIKIIEYTMTRNILLYNEETGTEDYCFDDSALFSDDINFEFMELRKSYNCKIQLFGSIVEEQTNSSIGTKIEIKIINLHVLLGKKERIKVQAGNDIYYIPKEDFEDAGIVLDKVSVGDTWFYDFTRKDLIQVDNVVHKEYLK